MTGVPWVEQGEWNGSRLADGDALSDLASGIVSDLPNLGQQAYIGGRVSPVRNDQLRQIKQEVFRTFPLNVADQQVRCSMKIYVHVADPRSTDLFSIILNEAGLPFTLFSFSVDCSTGEIIAGNRADPQRTGKFLSFDTLHELAFEIDYAQSRFTILLNGEVILGNQPLVGTIPGFKITAFGSLLCVWFDNSFGDFASLGPARGESNYMLVDDLLIENCQEDCPRGTFDPVPLVPEGTSVVPDFSPAASGSPPDATGSLTVGLGPAGIGSGWRFEGEKQWREPGVPVGGLPSSSRVIEFRPVPGYANPAAETVVVMAGETSSLQRTYLEASTPGSGGVTVNLLPGILANEPVESDRAQWRLVLPDQPDRPWRNSGDEVTGLTPGAYEIECKWVEGWITPNITRVSLSDGDPLPMELRYRDAGSGAAQGLITFETVQNSPELPYGWIGQLQSEAGTATGFVVKERVVATAGHVVFDDRTLTTAVGLQWLFQRDRGTYEPEPVLPRGHHLLTDYAARRRTEIENGGTPGTSSPESQELDVAALWFTEPAGREGFSGFLASDAIPTEGGERGNEWLLSTNSKILAGYPVNTVPPERAGRMHASPASEEPLALAGSPHTYTAPFTQRGGGFSGAPLCVRVGAYIPAAIYLGGSDEPIVRAIDGAVVELFNRAEADSVSAENEVGGGISLTAPTELGASGVGALEVFLEPEAAREASEPGKEGAAWRLSTESAFSRRSGQFLGDLTPGSVVTLQFKPLAGFLPPIQHEVTIVDGQVVTLTFTYEATKVVSSLGEWRQELFGTDENSGEAADGADPDGDRASNLEEFLTGSDPTDEADKWSVLSAKRTPEGFRMTANGICGRVYRLQRIAATDLASGGESWTEISESGPLTEEQVITLTDPSPPDEDSYYRIEVTLP